MESRKVKKTGTNKIVVVILPGDVQFSWAADR
jgi:hypothetical protein